MHLTGNWQLETCEIRETLADEIELSRHDFSVPGKSVYIVDLHKEGVYGRFFMNVEHMGASPLVYSINTEIGRHFSRGAMGRKQAHLAHHLKREATSIGMEMLKSNGWQCNRIDDYTEEWTMPEEQKNDAPAAEEGNEELAAFKQALAPFRVVVEVDKHLPEPYTHSWHIDYIPNGNVGSGGIAFSELDAYMRMYTTAMIRGYIGNHKPSGFYYDPSTRKWEYRENKPAQAEPEPASPERSSNEKIYDEQIAPLMAQIIEICKEHKIPFLASFQMEPENDVDSEYLCTSAILPKDCTTSLRQAYQIIE